MRSVFETFIIPNALRPNAAKTEKNSSYRKAWNRYNRSIFDALQIREYGPKVGRVLRGTTDRTELLRKVSRTNDVLPGVPISDFRAVLQQTAVNTEFLNTIRSARLTKPQVSCRSILNRPVYKLRPKIVYYPVSQVSILLELLKLHFLIDVYVQIYIQSINNLHFCFVILKMSINNNNCHKMVVWIIWILCFQAVALYEKLQTDSPVCHF